MQAIVVTFDRLATRLIGCYGNEWIETPNLDRLAAAATVFDNHFADTVGPNAGRAWFTGRHSCTPAQPDSVTDVINLLRQAGVSTELRRASSSRLSGWDNLNFDRVVQTAGDDGLDVDPNAVPIARLVQSGVSLLREPTPATNRLVWLHAPEPGLPPEGFATLYFEDFEERGLPMADVPREDWLKEIAVAAGSVSLVDHWIGELLGQINILSQEQPTLLIITAARGRSCLEGFLAEVPSVRGPAPSDLLRDQEIKSPLFLSIQGGGERFADFNAIRCPHFVQTTDLVPTLLDWFGLPISSGCEGTSLLKEALTVQSTRKQVRFSDDNRNLGIRTNTWNCLVRLAEENRSIAADVCFGDAAWPEVVQLFSKPDDIWDVTDQSTQQPEVCETLVRAIAASNR